MPSTEVSWQTKEMCTGSRIVSYQGVSYRDFADDQAYERFVKDQVRTSLDKAGDGTDALVISALLIPQRAVFKIRQIAHATITACQSSLRLKLLGLVYNEELSGQKLKVSRHYHPNPSLVFQPAF